MRRVPLALTLALVLALVLAVDSTAFAARAAQRFESLDGAVDALVRAFRSADRAALTAILGPQSGPLLSSGDAVADRRAFARFVGAYDEAHRLEGGGGRVRLFVGADEFPFPIPLVPDADRWRWDVRAGRDEILGRRIGRNELAAIQVCLAYVDAQREYFAADRTRTGMLEYAQRFVSRAGTHDGLYWTMKSGEPASPLGAMVAQARSEGYRRRAGGPPYHGYRYRILTAQGPSGPGGAYDYVVRGHMLGGFALVAFPARYGSSGVMTFIVNHDGVVFQKNLGWDTAPIASSMTAFDPDRSWQPAAPDVAWASGVLR